MDAGARRDASDPVGEGHGWQIDQIRPLRKANGPPGSPVHGDSIDWMRAADRLSRLPGIEMAPAKSRPPSSDWHEGEVDVRHLVERKVRTRVPRIPASVVSIDQIAESGSAMRASSVSAAIVVGGEDGYPKIAKLCEVAGLYLVERHAPCGDWLEQPPRACRDDENRGRWDQSQRRQVGVVGVKVGDQHEVCMCSVRGRHRTAHPTEMAKASGQNRVEQYGGVTVLPGAGAVPPPCQRGRHGTGSMELRGPYAIGMLG